MLQKVKNPHILLILISGFALSFAYIVEYVVGISPCPLCIYQRFPYLIFIMLAIIASASTNQQLRIYNILLALTAFCAVMLAFYHTGIERGIFELSAFCKPLVNVADTMSVADFQKILYNSALGMCNKPALVIFGVSMTELNLVLNTALLIFFIINIFKPIYKE